MNEHVEGLVHDQSITTMLFAPARCLKVSFDPIQYFSHGMMNGSTHVESNLMEALTMTLYVILPFTTMNC